MRIVTALLVAFVCARLILDLGEEPRRAVDVGISLLSLIIIQGWVLQSMFVATGGESPSLRSACSSCAMVMFLGAMLTLLLVFVLMASLGSHAKGLPIIVLPAVNLVVSIWMYWFLTTPRFCDRRLSIPAPGRAVGVVIAVVMSVIQLLLYVLVYLFMRP
tara:strand:- start:3711 stop:4190 length:480 start_codon:yes stop_codon:yes gene_type:complete